MLLTPELILKAYAVGVFPMAERRDDPYLYWVEPKRRGIIPLDDRFHVPRRLARTIRQGGFDIRTDTAFESVVAGCAAPAPGREETWINDEIVRLYNQLQLLGHAHSVEVWQGESLVGGLYGISLGGAFFGESMFSRVRDASKIALVHLVERLRRGGYRLLDAQFMTDHLKRFGAYEVSRDQYRRMLDEALDVQARFYSAGEAAAARQSFTQMS